MPFIYTYADAERAAVVLEEQEKPGAQPPKVHKVKKKDSKAGLA